MAKISWKTEEEIKSEQDLRNRLEDLPKTEERIAMLEEMIMQLLLMS